MINIQYEKDGIEKGKDVITIVRDMINVLKGLEQSDVHDYLGETISDLHRGMQEWGIDQLQSNIKSMEENIRDAKKEGIE